MHRISRLCSIGLALAILLMGDHASAQLRVVTFNTANATGIEGNVATPRTGMDLVLQAIGDEATNGYARPIDILMLQEQDDVATTTQDFVDILNGIYGAGTYWRGTVLNAATTRIHTGIVYNTQSVTLLEEVAFGQVSGTKSARQPMRYKFRPVGYTSSADFYVYNSHYKASTGTENEDRREFEAETIRANADALGQGVHIIYGGDYNIQSSLEASYQTMLSAGNGQAFDPINTPGTWHNDITFAPIHTQSPHDGSDGLAQGGMDDRLDFLLVTGEFMDNEGLSYISGSYHAFGNNGTTFNLAVNAPGNTYPLGAAQLDALAHVSDHLPVVADYQLPAKMQVVIDPIPAQVILNADVSVTVTVLNTAPVTVSVGADELDYTLGTLGGLSGGGSGSVPALSGGDSYPLAFDTSVAGPVNGQVNASSSSQAVANGSFFTGASTQVLDHADGSFSSDADTNLLSIDFGTLLLGGTVTEGFDLFNLVNTFGFTAQLDLDSVIGLGDTGVLGHNLAAFSGLAAGGSLSFLASFDTSSVGDFAATYALNLSDQDLPGATTQTLTLQLLGRVIEVLTGDLDGDGFVGIADLNLVLGHWNASVTAGDPLSGDPSGDGFVGIEDLNTVLGNWNAGTPPPPEASNANIPEPGAAVIFVLCACGFVRRRR